MHNVKYDEVIQAIDSKLSSFRKVLSVNTWYHCIGTSEEDLLESALSSEQWKEVHPGYTWSSARGVAWFHKDVTLPETINDVSLIGSSVELIFLFPIGATLFVNGKEVYHEPFWADTRPIPVMLTDSLQPGETLSVTVKAKQGDGFGLFAYAALQVGALDSVIFNMELFREQLKFCKYLLDRKEHDEGNANEELAAFRKAIDTVNIEALRNNDWDAWNASTVAAVNTLMVFDRESKEYETYLIAHSHIDMNWLWTWEETVDVCRRDFTAMDRLMDKYPDFHFSQSQAATYKAMEDYHPEVLDVIAKRVKEGRWDITASTWVEGDLNTALGETLVRQILHTRRYIQQKFGVTPKICWEPDTFGHCATYPQILKKSGIEYYYFCRAGKGHPVFWWEAPDGSRVLAYCDPYGYGGEVTPFAISDCCKLLSDRLDLRMGLWVYGVGDHGGAATANDIERAHLIDTAPLLPKATSAKTTDFYEKLESADTQYPVVRDELNTIFEGCYTSHADIKWLNRYGENSLLTSETLSCLAGLTSDYSYPLTDLADAWKNQCFHQFHDIICGCSIGSTYREAADTLGPSHEMLKKVTQDAMAKLASNVHTEYQGDSQKIVVFNQLGWNRTDLVEISLDELSVTLDELNHSCIQDESGVQAPIQVLDNILLFIAKDVPSMGCKVYKLIKGDSSKLSQVKANAKENTIENEHVRIRINSNSGAIDSLGIKDSNRDLAAPRAGWGPEGKVNAGMLNRFMIYYEQPHPMSAWNMGDITRIDSLISGAQVKLIESGPVCAAVEVKHKFLNSSLVQQIRIYSCMERIDFITEIDWHEKGSATEDAPMLKVTFTPFLGQTKATYEIPYGTIERVADGREVPALRWADLSEKDFGLSLLNNCKYGHHAQGNTLGLTLVRASYEPDNNPDEGIHNFSYSLYPHKGTWKEAQTELVAAGFNQPLMAKIEASHPGTIMPGEANIECFPTNVIISAVKYAETQPEDSTAVIIRLFEGHGKETTAHLRLKWKVERAEEVNMVEESEKTLDVHQNTISLEFGKHEIKTLKLFVKH